MSMSQVPRDDQSRPLRVALFGCGKMGIHHLRAIATLSEARVVGIADPALDRASIADLVGPDVHLCTDPAELLDSVRPDVVHIVTPPATHPALARLAIAAGCHVYVEKPFASTRAEAEAVLTLADGRSVAVCPGHQCLFEPWAQKAIDALPQIGSLVHVESYFSFRMVRRSISAVDQIKDILPHAVYPVVEQLRAGSGSIDEPIAVVGLNVQPRGEVHALVRLGACTGVITVTLNGRPIEQYQRLVGTNGSLRADYVSGSFEALTGPGTGAGILFTPYRRALQTLLGATGGFARRFFQRQSSYLGLQHLIGRFYASILDRTPAPISPRSILETVGICEQIGSALDQAGRREEATARERFERAVVPPLYLENPRIVVTGGTGQLGRRVAAELRNAGFAVRAIARRAPSYAVRLPGVEYVTADLTQPLDASIVDGADFVVHCAAETAGGRGEHERNSIAATRHVVEAAARAHAKVIHISSLAVLKPGHGRKELDEESPVDVGNLERGPYVWGKAESEALAQRLSRELEVPLVVIRPGPLVDYAAFQAPGRLGREAGPLFVAVGSRKNRLDVCDVGSAARVIRSYVEDFESAPPMLNLVDTPSPTRGELVRRLLAVRSDLRIVWLPSIVLRAMSGPLKLLQRVILGTRKPVDILAAFASEHYRTSLAKTILDRADAAASRPRCAAAARRCA